MNLKLIQSRTNYFLNNEAVSCGRSKKVELWVRTIESASQAFRFYEFPNQFQLEDLEKRCLQFLNLLCQDPYLHILSLHNLDLHVQNCHWNWFHSLVQVSCQLSACFVNRRFHSVTVFVIVIVLEIRHPHQRSNDERIPFAFWLK